jgi:addiction module RelB/DinJ family antitoxin
MDTTIHLKTKKVLKERAEKLANSLGLTLTGLINLNLSQLVEASELVINLHPRPNEKTIKELNRLRKESELNKNLSKRLEIKNGKSKK